MKYNPWRASLLQRRLLFALCFCGLLSLLTLPLLLWLDWKPQETAKLSQQVEAAPQASLATSAAVRVEEPPVPALVPVPSYRTPAASQEIILHGSRAKQAVALTFDDGPGPYTAAVLDALKAAGVRATFFLNGYHIPAGEEHARALVARMHREGHLVASHSLDHGDFRTKSRAEIQANVRDNCRLIRAAMGPTEMAAVRFFRFPYGAAEPAQRRVVAEAGYRMVGWDVDTKDWKKGRTAAAIEQHVLAQAQPGSIILAHDGGRLRQPTLAALPGMIQGLRRKGYDLVRLDELMGEPPYTAEGCEAAAGGQV